MSSDGFNPYFIGLPILIIMDLSNMEKSLESFNPYFIGLPILISSKLYGSKVVL